MFATRCVTTPAFLLRAQRFLFGLSETPDKPENPKSFLALGNTLRAVDLTLDEKFSIKTDTDQVIASVTQAMKEEELVPDLEEETLEGEEGDDAPSEETADSDAQKEEEKDADSSKEDDTLSHTNDEEIKAVYAAKGEASKLEPNKSFEL